MRINNEVLVLHGGNCPVSCACSSASNHPPFPGLCRSGVATLEQLKAIDRRRPVPVSTADPADVLFFDTMWAGDASLPDQRPIVHTLPDFPSSTDPQPHDGFGTSVARGAGCVTFGPDVTRRFCEINRLRMIVRSHEVPKTMTGVQAEASHHQYLGTGQKHPITNTLEQPLHHV